jgi:hypothetical protein
MNNDFKLEIIDTSGVKNLIDFDFRNSSNPNIYYDIRKSIKNLFNECIVDMITLFPQNTLHFSVNLEQEIKKREVSLLACFDAERSYEGHLCFRIYYDSILQLASFITDSGKVDMFKQFKSTLYHELVHAADIENLRVLIAANEFDLNRQNSNFTGSFFDSNKLLHQVNVQWALLLFFSIFRAEGIAIIGEKLLNNNYDENPANKAEVFQSFNAILNRVLEICSGLEFYNNFENHTAIMELNDLSLFAYEYADILFIHALQKEEIIEKLKLVNSNESFHSHHRKELLETIKVFINTDLSEFIQLLLSLPELCFREKFLHVCSVIQREGDPNTISEFSRNLLWSGYNKNAESFISILKKIMGSRIPDSELFEMHQKFSKESYSEDIILEIQKMAFALIKFLQSTGNDVAQWALTYLFDQEDMIHDSILYLGWQDDWVVLDSAMRILDLKIEN